MDLFSAKCAKEERTLLPHDRQQNTPACAPHKPQRGFTLLELLIVVAIIVVLSAVAIPLIGKSREQLKTTELDAIARQIFVAAQNKSTAMMALGSFDDFDAAESKGGASVPAGVSAPADYHYAAHVSLDADYLGILPAGSIDSTVLNNRYFIEYNYKTGDIYGVFYAEDDSLTYAEAAALRDASPRKTPSGVTVGYFGGAEGSGLETMRTKAPRFKLVNDEELYVKFEGIEEDVTYTLTVTDATSPSAEPIRFRIGKSTIGNSMRSEPTLSGATVAVPIKRDVAGNIYIILDSLDPTPISNPTARDRRFCTSFTDTEGVVRITPGHDLYISGKAQKALDEDEKIVYLESDEVSYLTNSLFDSVSREKGKNEACTVCCFRHLQNLDAASGYKPESALFEARLTASLDWTATAAALQLTDAKTPKATKGYAAPKSLTAISHASLLTFDGQGNGISNTPLGANKNGAASDGTAGLFGVFTGREGSEIRRVRLINASLAPGAETAAQYAGLLAGKIQGEKAALTDCQVYANPKDAQAFSACKAELPKSVLYFGGLTGYMESGIVTDCFAAMPNAVLTDDAPASARFFGGLIGQAKDVSLLRCYANTDLTLAMGGARDLMGGLIGLADGGKCETCYASGILSVKAAQAGCQLSGFANATGSAAFSSCYTAATYGEGLYAPEYLNPKDESTPASNAGAKVYAFSDVLKGASADDRYYLRTAGITEFADAGGTQTYGTGLDYDDMAKNSAWIVPSQWKTDKNEKDTHPYMMTGAYPFPVPSGHGAQSDKTLYPIPHYGDWPARQGVKYLAYYEKYEGGSFGFFVQNGAEADTLQDGDSAVVIDDGYAVLCEATDSAPVLLYITAEGLRSADLTDSGASVSVKPKNGPAVPCKAYLFPAAALEDSVAQKQTAVLPPAVTVKDSYYHAFSASGYRFFANPNFAKYVVNGQDGLPGASMEPAPIALRTSRQLHRLSLPGQDAYWDRAFYQERKIDFMAYPARVAAQLSPQPIGNSAVPFTGIFDGGRHIINGLPVALEAESPDKAYAGMFGLCAGTARLTRIRLQNPSVNAALDGAPASCAGILAGKLSNQAKREGSKDYMVSDCYVYAKDTTPNVFSGSTGLYGGCTLITNASTVGGLAGMVENCSVIDSLVSATAIEMQSGDRAGGFAGTLAGTSTATGEATRIQQCYANTKLFKAKTVGMLGGFAGESTMNVYGAYAVGKLSAKTASDAVENTSVAGFILQNNGSCADCYTLCTYQQAEDADKDLHQTNAYGFCKPITGSNYLTNCYYYGTAGVVATLSDASANQTGVKLTYGQMKTEMGRAGSAYPLDAQRFSAYTGSTYPYELGGGYPFIFLTLSDNSVQHTNIMPHYGDWPTASGTFLAYYEKYEEANGKHSYGYYTNAFNLLDNAGDDRAKQKKIVEDGYAILSDTVPQTVTYGRDNKTLSLSSTEQDVWQYGDVKLNVYRFDAASELMTMGRKLDLAEKLKINPNLPDPDGSRNANYRFSFYYKVVIDGATYYFNPSFAKTVTPTLSMDPARVSVRTERQLRCLADGRTDYRYWGWLAQDIEHPDTLSVNPNTIWFVQDHDIEPMGNSATTANLIPIGRDQRYFCGGYDGDHYLIKNFSVSGSGQHIALFGYNIGQLCNIVFVTDIGNTVIGPDRIGTLVGVNDVKDVTYLDDNKTATLRGGVANCIAAGFSVSANGIGGGFAYANYGDIADCAAILYTSRRTGGALACVGGSGGFVCVNGDTGKLSHCFAVTTNTATDNLSSQCGFVRDMGGDITDCYCAGVNSESKYMGFNSQYVPAVQLTGGRLAYDGTNHSSIRDAFADYKVEDEAHTHPIDPALTGACPWPSFQKGKDGKCQFYGNWMIP